MPILAVVVWSFSETKTDFFAWISSILDHWGIVGTGGLLVLLIQIVKERWPKLFTWQFSRRVFLAFLVIAVFQSWEEEYKAHVRLDKELAIAKTKIDGMGKDREIAVNGIKAECAVKDGINQTLQKQNRDQQNLIAGCQQQALKLLEPPKQRTTQVMLDSTFQAGNGKMRWVLVTNKPFSPPVHIGVSCTLGVHRIESASLQVLNGGPLGGIQRGGRTGESQWELVASSMWSPETPLLIAIDYQGERNLACALGPF